MDWRLTRHHFMACRLHMQWRWRDINRAFRWSVRRAVPVVLARVIVVGRRTSVHSLRVMGRWCTRW